LPAFNWTAIKITQFGHNVCSATSARRWLKLF
jgi:hypothetical protein